jgi:hypothetical protein
MAKKFYQTDEFLKKQAKWYAKLEKEGHEDIEAIDPKTGDPYPVMTTSRGCYNSSSDVLRKYSASSERYFELARAHYWTMEGTNEEREAFRLYAQLGMRVAAIQRAMGVSYDKLKKMIQAQEALFLPSK